MDADFHSASMEAQHVFDKSKIPIGSLSPRVGDIVKFQKQHPCETVFAYSAQHQQNSVHKGAQGTVTSGTELLGYQVVIQLVERRESSKEAHEVAKYVAKSVKKEDLERCIYLI